jgi:hypothetical protein
MSSSNPAQSVTKTLVVKPGQTMVLKAGVNIVSIIKEGNIAGTTNCETLQDQIDNAETMACFKLVWVAEGNKNNDTGPFSWANGDMKIVGFGIGDSFFDMNNLTFNIFSSENERSENFVTRLNTAMGASAIVKPVSVFKTGNIGERDEFKFVFKAPLSLGTTAYLKISSPSAGDTDVVEGSFFARKCDDCCSSNQ